MRAVVYLWSWGIIGLMSLTLALSMQQPVEANSGRGPVAAEFRTDYLQPAVLRSSAPVEAFEQQTSRKDISDAEFILAATMWGEARSEGKTGMGYVGHVVMNRAKANFRGNTVIKAALHRKQFSCWNRNDPNRVKLTREYLENSKGVERQRWEEAKYLAHHILRGSHDYTNGALHYHTTSINPNWSGDYQVVSILGRHIFYR